MEGHTELVAERIPETASLSLIYRSQKVKCIIAPFVIRRIFHKGTLASTNNPNAVKFTYNNNFQKDYCKHGYYVAMFTQSRALAWGRGGRKGVPASSNAQNTHIYKQQVYHPETYNPTTLILRINANRSFLCKFIPFNKSFIVLNYLLGDSSLLVLFHDLSVLKTGLHRA